MELQEIKAKLDIIEIARSYGFEFKGSGNRLRAITNLLREERTSSLDFFQDTQKYYDRGTASGGDVIDLIMHMENLSQAEAIKKAKELAGMQTYNLHKKTPPAPQKKPVKKEVNFNQLAKQAINEKTTLKKMNVLTPVQYVNDKDEVVKEEIILSKEFQKLFEAQSFEKKYEKRLRYIFDNLLGWSDFWKAPSIILTDRDNKVVDIVTYRPKDKETGQEIDGMKYYYKNFNGRGNRFVFPFELLVNRLALKEKYIVIGEGLKNALNALVYGVPFISIESTGNSVKLSNELLNLINAYLDKGFGVVTAFDGDEAGEKAYNNFIQSTGLTAENIWDFKSGVDFVEWLKADENGNR